MIIWPVITIVAIFGECDYEVYGAKKYSTVGALEG